MRLFVAIDPPEEARAHLAARAATLHVGTSSANTRLTPPQQWHVTLAFLGEIPDDRLPDVDRALRRVPPVDARLRVAGGGRFGTILWAGLAGDLDRLTDLGAAVRRELGHDGLPFDPRPFRPHLTLARPGDRLDHVLVEADRAALDDYSGPEWAADSFRLMRSHPGVPPVYAELRRYPT